MIDDVVSKLKGLKGVRAVEVSPEGGLSIDIAGAFPSELTAIVEGVRQVEVFPLEEVFDDRAALFRELPPEESAMVEPYTLDRNGKARSEPIGRELANLLSLDQPPLLNAVRGSARGLIFGSDADADRFSAWIAAGCR